MGDGFRGWRTACCRTAVLLEELTREVIGAALEVHTTLGAGLVESIYRNALSHELQSKGISFQAEHEIRITYKNSSSTSARQA